MRIRSIAIYLARIYLAPGIFPTKLKYEISLRFYFFPLLQYIQKRLLENEYVMTICLRRKQLHLKIFTLSQKKVKSQKYNQFVENFADLVIDQAEKKVLEPIKI